MSVLKDRKVGLIAAFVVWGLLLATSTGLDRMRRATTARRNCLTATRHAMGALEMYGLDQNLPGKSLCAWLLKDASAVSDTLFQQGYQLQPRFLPEGCQPRFSLVGTSDVATVNVDCEAHPGLALDPDPVNAPTWEETSDVAQVFVMAVDGAAWLVFPVLFWVAGCLRAHRFSQSSDKRRLPLGWVLALNVLFAPAGLLAMGCRRQAAWQFLAMMALPLTFEPSWWAVILIMSAWTGWAWKRFHSMDV